MRHVVNHIMSLGGLHRGSSEENEMKHKEFKQLYTATNKHIDSIAPQQVVSWCNDDIHSDMDVECKDSDGTISQSASTTHSQITNLWESEKSDAIECLQFLGGCQTPTGIRSDLLRQCTNSVQTWKLLKCVSIRDSSPYCYLLKQISLFVGVLVYGKTKCHGGGMFTHKSRNKVSLIDWLVVHRHPKIPSALVLYWSV